MGNKQFWTTFRNSLKEYLLWRTSVFGHIYEELRGATLKSSWGPASGLWRTSLAQLRGPALERISCYHCWKYERIYIIFDIIFVCSIYIFFFFNIWKGKFGPVWCNQFGIKMYLCFKIIFKFDYKNRRGEQNCDSKKIKII